jgi:diadenosine tetraphosphatase ApaH/serine/threonine PP2A family protein phosphatase
MALTAIFGDIHSNIDALSVVMDDCASRGVEQYLCTGDVIGYNASPHECMDIVRQLNCPVTMGNHDYYVSSGLNLNDFNPHAARVVEWTRSRLSADEMEFLKNLPFTYTAKGVSVVHATMDRPHDFGYVFDNFQAGANFMSQKTPICFHGHTHCPMIYEFSLKGVFRIDPAELQGGVFKMELGRKYFINAGSVGQPRDGDPRSSYVLYDSVAKTVEFRRLEYDIKSAQAKILEAGLPERLAERLAEGS